MKKQTIPEEIANSITHGLGILFGIVALVLLVVIGAKRDDAWRVVSFSIYGSTIILLYTASTLYHAFQKPKLKRFFKLMDHCSIYLLIAGTYTPIVLTDMRGGWGWSLFGVIWGLAILGIFFKIYFLGRFKAVSVTIYLLMGWMIIIAIKPMMDMTSAGMIRWLMIGGASYTVGVIFYIWRRIPYHHSVWHLFVLGGSLSHFFGILFHIGFGS